MIVAVQVQPAQLLALDNNNNDDDNSCFPSIEGNHSSRLASVDSSDATHAIFQAILRTVWGVSPLAQRWNSLRATLSKDQTWALSTSDHFGTSWSVSSYDLPFSQWDAIANNIFYTEIYRAFTALHSLLEHLKSLEEEFNIGLEEALSSSDQLQISRRWNLLEFKLLEAQRLLSLHRFNASLQFVRSMHYDITAMHKLVHSAVSRNLHWTIRCTTSKIREEWALFDYGKLFIVCLTLMLTVGYWARFGMLSPLAAFREKAHMKKRDANLGSY